MDFNEFASLAGTIMEQCFPEADFTIKRINKAGTSRTVIIGRVPGCDVAPTLELLPFYDMIPECGIFNAYVSLEKSLRLGFDEVHTMQCRLEDDSPEDYGAVRDRLFVRLMNADDDFLSRVPHVMYADLALVYYIEYNVDAMRGAICVDNNLMDAWGVSADALHRDAIESAQRLFPPLLRGLRETLGISDEVAAQEDIDAGGTYVASNEKMAFGASVIAYPGFLDEAASRMHGSYYILPSSVHELILVPEADADPASLEETVRHINMTEVLPRDRLSDRVYRYDARRRLFHPASEGRCR